jgi:hypothetical protein
VADKAAIVIHDFIFVSLSNAIPVCGAAGFAGCPDHSILAAGPE